MRPVSAGFLAAATGSHKMTVHAYLLGAYAEGTSPGGTELAVSDGSVTLDSTADVRGSLDLTTDGTGWDPRPRRDPLQPYGAEIFVQRGIVVGGAEELVSQGYFKITDAELPQPGGPLRITGADRMQTIIDAQITSPRSYGRTNNVAAVFDELVLELYPAATIDFDYDAAGDELGSKLVTDTDRYGFLAALATSRGKIMYWDYQGHLAIKSPPDPGSPVITLAAGRGGVLVSADETLSRDGVFNGWVVTGDGADSTAAPLAVAYDANPASPTYWFGPFGQVPGFWSDPAVKDASSAAAAAVLMLQKSVQLPLTADFDQVPNPALEPLDVVKLAYRGAAPDAVMQLDTITLPLTPAAAMSASAHDPGPMRIAVI